MAQLSPNQAIVLEAINRIKAAIPNPPPSPFAEFTLQLSIPEANALLPVLQAFVATPGEPS
jgi:hypothetical protein